MILKCVKTTDLDLTVIIQYLINIQIICYFVYYLLSSLNIYSKRPGTVLELTVSQELRTVLDTRQAFNHVKLINLMTICVLYTGDKDKISK